MKWLILVLSANCLQAVTYTVTTNLDNMMVPPAGSLREAIDLSNITAGPNNIIFTLGIGSETILLDGPLPNINPMMGSFLTNVDGSNGGNRVTIDGNSLHPGFTIDNLDTTGPTAFTLQNITFNHCLALGNFFGFGIGGSLLSFSSPAGLQFIIQDVDFLNSKAQGADGLPTGGFAWGGAALTGLPFTVQGSAIFNGTNQPGNPPPSPDANFGWTIYSPNSNEPTVFIPTAPTDTISFTDNFLIAGPLIQNGPGTVSLSTTATTAPAGQDFPNSVYYVFGDTTIQDGTFNLDGEVVRTAEGVLLPLPIFGAIGGLTFQNNTRLTGNGLVFAGDGQITTYESGSTIAPSPGILLLAGEIDFQAGSIIKTTVEPTQTASVMLMNFTVPSPARNIQGATLHVDVTPGAYPDGTVYALILSQEIFDGTFQDILVTGSFSATLLGLGAPFDPPTVIYSPTSAPNSVLMPVNVPFGISLANIVIGTVTLQSTVFYDACAGIIVINLLAPGQGAAALSQFFANQTALTAQTLGSLTASLNANCLKKNEGRAVPAATPVAAWYEQKDLLLAQSSVDATPPNPTPPEADLEKREEPERKLLPSLLFQKKQTPNYSISLTPFGQFQNQDQIVTSTAVLPAYGTQTYGAILGFDYIGLETILVGGAASFAWTDLTVAKGEGGQQTWSAFGTAYSSFTFGHFFFNLLATGSYNYNTAVRNFAPIEGETITIESATPFGIQSVYTFQATGVPGGTSFSKYNVYQLVPHLDLNYEIGFGSVSLVPFILSDCSISFADSIKETGQNFLNPNACSTKISLNTKTDSLTTFILQSEAGLNLFEQRKLHNDQILIFRQKASYVNRYFVPYTLRSKLVESESYIKIPISLPIQHMFGAAFEMVYRKKTFSTVLTYQGMVGSGYISNAGYARFAYDF